MKKTILILAIFIYLLPLGVVNAQNYYEHQVGLNAHWTLGGFHYDHMYEYRLKESNTQWVREHFYHEVFALKNPEGWYNRYDWVMNKYQQQGIHVVGMLAYGKENGNFWPPEQEDWELFVRTVVERYADKVDVWEVWNEPDSPDYLVLNNPETFGPLLEQAYPIIKQYDPSSTVIIGGLTYPNYGFMEALYQNYSNYFDAPAFHVYNCNSYNSNRTFGDLETNLKKFKEVIDRNRPGDKAWVTEVGCSTLNVSEQVQSEYLDKVHELLFGQGWIARTFVYNIRDREIDNEYENHFGLLDRDLSTPKPSWKWYLDIPVGPYGVMRKSPTEEQEKAVELKGLLESEFGGPIPLDQKHWPAVFGAYMYGGYPVQAIAQAIRLGGYTVHSRIPFTEWQNSSSYQEYINKPDPKTRKSEFAYGQTRKLIDEEQSKARELRQKLETEYVGKDTGITGDNWGLMVNAYVYGGYPVEAIARAKKYGWKTVHTSIPYSAFQYRSEYQENINKGL